MIISKQLDVLKAIKVELDKARKGISHVMEKSNIDYIDLRAYVLHYILHARHLASINLKMSDPDFHESFLTTDEKVFLYRLYEPKITRTETQLEEEINEINAFEERLFEIIADREDLEEEEADELEDELIEEMEKEMSDKLEDYEEDKEQADD